MKMKNIMVAATLALAFAFSAHAQVFILNENVFKERMGTIKTTVVDSVSGEPVGFASVYVIPSKDTTITNFTMTDAKGEAKLEEVPFGSYVFHVEMMGYKTFLKEKYFREGEMDMGIVKLQPDLNFIQAATVTGVGNPIVIKQDTVEFNASSFRVGANAMLKDLLRRMPGMEITETGKVKFNGEEIDKLTLGGRTFFFNDQSTALNNLPASVVDKIRVIDRESEETRASGIQDGNREKVLDVALKKEYEKGLFGNIGLKGGTTLGDKNEALRDDRGLLWNGNVLASAYSDKDQLTMIANGQNINESIGAIFISIDSDGASSSSLDQGLSSAGQFGVNANTSRIKNVETTASVNYKYTDTDSGTKTERTTYQDGGNLLSTTQNKGKSYGNSLTANAEFKKENGKIWFHVNPSFRYSKSDETSAGSTRTLREDTFLNSSDNTSRSNSNTSSASFVSDVTFRGLWDQTGRNLRLNFSSSLSRTTGESSEASILTTSSGKGEQLMDYDSHIKNYSLVGGIQYTEPLGDKWTLSASGSLTWQHRDNTRDAFDEAGRNDYYSSVSNTKYFEQKYGLTAQYKFGKSSWLTLGGSLSGLSNETYSKSFGIKDVTGKDEWIWLVTPTVRFQHSFGSNRLNFSAYGYTRRPSNSSMIPALNISNPSRLSLGNIYLKPYTLTYFNLSWSRNNMKKFSNLMCYLSGQVYNKALVSALWYDTDGILYSLPVNSKKHRISSSIMVNYTTPLDGKKLLSLSINNGLGYSSDVSYQAKSTLSSIDKNSFDYSAFIADFWGNSDGDRFYDGLSGFAESRTWTLTPRTGFALRYNPERWYAIVGTNVSGNISRYSLNSKNNMNTLDISFNASGSYTTKHEFEFDSDLSYVIYKGYSKGYGDPEWQWNAEISKNIGAFNLSCSVHDILNQTRDKIHTVTANYEEDSFRLIMGRYILFGVKWNFGKMNATHSARAQQAAFDMVF